jgi:D-cysteine desulfhydrase
MDCILVLTGERPAEASGNLPLDHLLGARIAATTDRRDRDRLLAETVESAAVKGKAPTWSPTGAAARPERRAMPLRCRRSSGRRSSRGREA